MSQPLIYGLNRQITTIGSLGIGLVKDEAKVRFVTSFAGPANLFRVRARIVGQGSWNTIADLTGIVNTVVDVFTWDEIEVICLVYDSSANSVKIVATSFDNAVGPTFQLPDSTEVEGTVVKFTSTDNSVVFTGDPVTGEIDFSVPAAAGKYIQSFATGDWTLNVDRYQFSIPESAHGAGTSPKVQIFELSGAVFDLVNLELAVNASGDITLSVLQSPDLRFTGKIVIS
jgi:hypothetical protein